jgi:hypothetical protein
MPLFIMKDQQQRNISKCYCSIIQNLYNWKMKTSKSNSKSKFSKEEDLQIQQLVKIYGQEWSKISKELKTRNSRQIRERYVNYLDPNLNHEKWSIEEDDKLLFLLSSGRPYQWKDLKNIFQEEQMFQSKTDIKQKNFKSKE